MRLPHSFFVAALGVTALAGCPGPSHHVRYMGFRRVAPVEACQVDTLPVHSDHGPERPLERFAVVTAECRDSKEPECQQHLRQGGCDARADALIEVTNTVSGGRRRMLGMAVEYVDTPPSSGGSAARP